MNTLSRLDSYVSSLFYPSSSSSSSSSTSRPQLKRYATPPSQLSSSTSASSSSSTSTPRLSNLPPTPRRGRKRTRRRAPQTYSSIKVPPPTTPLILRIALVLWSILLSFWRSLVGETRAGRSRSRRLKGVRSGSGGVLRELSERVMVSAGLASGQREGEGEGSGSEAEPEAEPASGDGDDGWVDPVTRAPEDQDSLDTPLPTEDEFAIASREDEPILAETQAQAKPRSDPSKFTFRLRSAPPKQGKVDEDGATLEEDTRPALAGYQRPPTPRSILANPLPGSSTATPITKKVVAGEDEEGQRELRKSKSNQISTTTSTISATSRKTPKILANPISTSILDPSVPAPSSNSASSLFRKASPPLRIPRPHQTPFHLQKTLILDLDETLIHSTSRPLSGSSSGGGGILGLSLGGLVGRGKGREGHAVEVVLNGRSTMYHVYKRPYVDHFLKKVASWYTLVIFTASMPEYADPVIDWLDAGRNLFARKLYRDSCHLQPNGSYTKDLALVEADLSRVCFMDNSPISYNWNKANALPIEGWTSDPYDEALLHSIPVLDSLRFVNDVRRVLGIRGFT
ncbi:hypothetical protein IAT40_003928 [Kwoniella sp. CBS 6097]